MNNFMSREETTNKIKSEGILTVEWCIDDVREKCPSLNDEECKEVLKYMYDIFAYDNYGIIVGADAIVWPLIDNSINDCFPEKWDKYTPEDEAHPNCGTDGCCGKC